ncbi:MAG: CHC2 zinc finger domain-containing protein, partial [Clostridia bacterium]|nr:CHC2 zinc finger domain-containing protein [Clostridia bacterium]
MATSEFQEFVQTLKDKVNIVDVVSGYVQLERKGNSWWGCCPFHHEKTASFVVNEPDKYYHCFGCSASGDVIKFVQDIEDVDFMDAVKILADRVKLPVPAPSGADAAKTMELKQRKDMCLKVVNETAHFYLRNLRSGRAQRHLEYIESRNISRDVVTKFGLGASMNFNDLPKFLADKGYTPQQMLDAGVCAQGEDGRIIDAQGGRLIYPIINAFDEVIAFGGRLLKKADNLAKYKNTKDTIIFNKSRTLYNINLLKKLKKQQKIAEVIMVEGYMDTISLYSA